MAIDKILATRQEVTITNGEIQSDGVHVNGNKKKPEKPLMGPDQPLPHVSELNVSTAASVENLLNDIVGSLRVSGGCVVRNMIGKDVLDQLDAEITPHLKAAKPAPGTVLSLATICYSLISSALTYHFERRELLASSDEKSHGMHGKIQSICEPYSWKPNLAEDWRAFSDQ